MVSLNITFPLTYFDFTGFIGDSPQAGNSLLPRPVGLLSIKRKKLTWNKHTHFFLLLEFLLTFLESLVYWDNYSIFLVWEGFFSTSERVPWDTELQFLPFNTLFHSCLAVCMISEEAYLVIFCWMLNIMCYVPELEVNRFLVWGFTYLTQLNCIFVRGFKILMSFLSPILYSCKTSFLNSLSVVIYCNYTWWGFGNGVFQSNDLFLKSIPMSLC